MTTTKSTSYEKHRDRAGRRQREQARSGRDIGAIPPVADVARRKEAEGDFRTFCETYLGDVFNRQWSPDHLRVIAKIQAAVLDSGQAAMAMPRGTGKSSLCSAGVLWSGICGHHAFTLLIAANAALGKKLLTNLKGQLLGNDLLAADFPEVIHPLRALENEARRAAGQLHHGRRTHSEWGSEQIVLPTIPGSRASGSVIACKGLQAGIRGLQHLTPAGQIVRPTLVLLDDPQTDASAKSPSMTRNRLETITGTVGGLAGPGATHGHAGGLHRHRAR